jgi:hypothetical protein
MAIYDEQRAGRVARLVLENLGLDLRRHVRKIAELLPATGTAAAPFEAESFNLQAPHLLAEVCAESTELQHTWVGSDHLVPGLLRCGPCAAGDYLRERGITIQ